MTLAVPSLTSQYTDIAVVFNDDTQKARLQNYLDEAVRCKQRILDEQANIKALRDAACEELQINKKLFSAMVSMLFNNDFEEKLEELGQLETAIHALMQTTS